MMSSVFGIIEWSYLIGLIVNWIAVLLPRCTSLESTHLILNLIATSLIIPNTLNINILIKKITHQIIKSQIASTIIDNISNILPK
jgi:hypothetical protein